MDTKVVLTFIVGLAAGAGAYHLASPGGERAAGDGSDPGAPAVGSILGGEGEAGSKPGEPAGGVAMPAGFEDVYSVDDIMAKAGPRDRFQAMMALVERIEPHEIEAALEEIRAGMTNQFDPEAMFAMHLLLMRWGEEDSEAAFASLEKLDMMQRGFGSMSVLAAVASKDPQQAAAWFSNPENLITKMPRIGDFMATALTKEWAKQNPDAALAWAKGLPEGQRAGAYNGVLGSLAADDPQRAARMALELDEGKDRRDLIGNIAESWGKQSPAQALEWVSQLEGEERQRALGQTLGGWAQTEPAEAAQYLDRLAEEERAEHVGKVAGPWARQDPPGAATWLQDQPEGDGKNEGMRQVMWMWTATDPQQASTWLAAQPEGPSRDHGIVSLAGATFEEDPQSAVTWAAAISDDNMREEHLDRGLNRWLRDEPETARQWVDTTQSLTPEDRQRVLGDPAPDAGAPATDAP